jgi:MFS family permease
LVWLPVHLFPGRWLTATGVKNSSLVLSYFLQSSLLSAWSWNLSSLTFFRFITGLGLGAAMPNITTLVAEYAPGVIARAWQP